MTRHFTVAIAAITLMASISSSQALTQQARDEIGRAAIDYLKNNPQEFGEVIQAVQAHAMKEQQEAQVKKVAANRDKIFQSGGLVPTLGNENGTLEVVVFMDPFCHFCRKFETTLKDAVTANKDLKIIARDIAIMHEKSVMLVKALLAAGKQGHYGAMQSKLHTVDPDITEQELYGFAKDMGMDVGLFKADLKSKAIETQVKDNMTLAQNLDISATPSFIIKGRGHIEAGYLPSDQFMKVLKG